MGLIFKQILFYPFPKESSHFIIFCNWLNSFHSLFDSFETISFLQDDEFKCSCFKGLTGTSVNALQAKETFPAKDRSAIQHIDIVCGASICTPATTITVLTYLDSLTKEFCSCLFQLPEHRKKAVYGLRPGPVYLPCQQIVNDMFNLRR